MRYVFLAVLLLPVSARAQTFTDVSETLLGGADASRLVYGVTVADVNRDGKPDIYQTGRLFLQGESGWFSDVLDTPRFQSMDGTEVFGGVFADADADGFPDLFVEDFDPGSRFFRNRFGIRWDLANQESGIDMSAAQSQGASWGDYDQDGDLDLFVGEEFGGNKLFESLGGGVFRDAGLSEIMNDRHSYGVAAADYDRDGDLDVYIAACYHGDPGLSVNSLFRNEGDGTFVDVAQEAQVADSLAGWAVVWTDFDRDGWPDIFVANMPIYGPDARPGFNMLYHNLGDGTFEEVGVAAGVAGSPDDFGFGGAAADFDNDGWEDLYLANDYAGGQGQNHQILKNMGDGTFMDVMPDAGIGPIDATLTVAVGDFNSDGWVDVVNAARRGNRLLLNQGGANGFLSVRLLGAGENRDAVGATVTAFIGDQPMVRFITAGDGMTSQNHDLSAHFGLGSAARIDSLVVNWPGGGASRLQDIDANQHLYFSETEGVNGPPTSPALLAPLDGAYTGDVFQVEWTASHDPDGDAVSYTLAMLSLNDWSEAGELIVEGATGTSVTVDMTDMPDGDYVWTVIGEDGRWKRGATKSHSFRKGGVTSVDNLPGLPGLELYPNPALHQLFVTSAQAGSLALIDVLGRRVGTYPLAPGKTTIDISGLASGIYLARVIGQPGFGVPVLKMR
ncbi:MAG: hypothetical protein ACI9BV_002255 [Rhodothermales bacterium]|jgi:hypothetical protein